MLDPSTRKELSDLHEHRRTQETALGSADELADLLDEWIEYGRKAASPTLLQQAKDAVARYRKKREATR